MDHLEPSPLKVTLVDHRRGHAVIAVEGEIDFTSASALRQQVSQLLGDRHRQLILDLAEVQRCDSAGLACLVAMFRQLREDGGSLHLVGVRPTVHRLLEITSLHTLFPIHRTAADVPASASDPG
ncbi:STAS domain-containing protein [Carbonactinospora thermoautotrophica]|uniref:STAS domain-containing protein n=1 Tax=Carbonactinospora thermoautotrophica TaxID=1469144 RepID=UPI00226D7B5F|nr:STAS domain-containing protein [Carbonactinospora thermoautotrophica]